LVFNEVQADLEAEGYEVFPYVLPACAVNAPHRRDRIWFVAFNTKSKRDTKIGGICERKNNESIGVCAKIGTTTNPDNARNATHGCRTDRNGEKESSQREQPQYEHNGFGNTWTTTNPDIAPTEHTVQTRGNLPTVALQQDATNPNSHRLEGSVSTNFNRQPSSSKEHDEKCLPTYIHGLQFKNFPTQSPICTGDDGLSTRLDTITFPKWRNESIKAAGNAIVPQVAFQIFKTIKLYNEKL
jgi:DNA (cytosine-5)-methyltransferase 1